MGHAWKPQNHSIALGPVGFKTFFLINAFFPQLFSLISAFFPKDHEKWYFTDRLLGHLLEVSSRALETQDKSILLTPSFP